MGATPVLLAAADLAAEPALVASAAKFGIEIRRRCLDAADLLASASLDPACAVVVSAGLARLSAEVVARLDGRSIVGLAASPVEFRRLSELGIASVIDAGAPPDAVLARMAELAAAPGADLPSGVWAVRDQARAPAGGRLVAVWGPPGAPGRSVVASALAEALAGMHIDTLLIDADTTAPAQAQRLGVIDEVSGLLLAARQADHGRLTPAALLGAARSLGPSMSLLAGLPSPSRWRDLRPASIAELWSASRRTFGATIADVASGLEAEGAAPGGGAALSMRRHDVARGALTEADALVIVVRADALGLMRAAQAVPEALALVADAQVVLAVNAVRSTSQARQAAAAIESLVRAAVLDEGSVRTVLLPWDRQVDGALARGALLTQMRRSTLLRSVRKIAVELTRPPDQGEGRTTTMVPILANS